MFSLTCRAMAFGLAGLSLLAMSGCAVPQSQDVHGKTGQIIEPATGRDYYLYLPRDYTPSGRYPLVVSIHGMKPFDNAFPQLMTWRRICDENGWVAIAPQLKSPDLLNQFPFRRIDSVLLEDETLIVSAIHDVIRRCSIDARHVMLTGWSSGGYLIHYIGARHPELFSLIAPQGSNFHESIMPDYVNDAARQLAIYVYHGASDLPVIVRDSNAAVQWYVRNGYRDVKMGEAPGGHERHPQLAAAYFLNQIRAAPLAAASKDIRHGSWLGTHVPAAPAGQPAPAGAAVALLPADELPPAPPRPVNSWPSPETVVSPRAPAPDGAERPAVDNSSVQTAAASPAQPAANTAVPRQAERTGTVREGIEPVEPTAAMAVAVPLGPAPPDARPAVPGTPERADSSLPAAARLPTTPVTAEPVAPTLSAGAPIQPVPANLAAPSEPLRPAGEQPNPLARTAPAPSVGDAFLTPAAGMSAVPPDSALVAVRILPSARSGRAPLTVEFRCELRGISAEILRYRWRVDGSLFGTTHLALLTFHQPGTHQVELTVVDAAGNSYRTSMTIHATAE